MERRAAFDALEAVLMRGGFLKEYLSDASPLTYEITNGVMRQLGALESHLKRLNKGHRLKRKERLVLMIALYQYLHLDKVPLYAIVNESVDLAKQVCHSRFTKFCNAFLRNLPLKEEFPTDNLSYPDFLLKNIDRKYLKIMNKPPKHFARNRNTGEMESVQDVQAIGKDPDYYIQNPTTWNLMRLLAEKTDTPKTILDLCSAPGGKAIAAYDLYPQAEITVNEPSEKRGERLRENLEKYEIPATYTNFDGTEYPEEKKFDLIIIDAPCSNTGVLGKRPESRWRIDKEKVAEHRSLQQALVDRARTLISPNGVIWYLTCSILPAENERLVEKYAPKFTHTITPDEVGNDGGFCALMTTND